MLLGVQDNNKKVISLRLAINSWQGNITIAGYITYSDKAATI